MQQRQTQLFLWRGKDVLPPKHGHPGVRKGVVGEDVGGRSAAHATGDVAGGTAGTAKGEPRHRGQTAGKATTRQATLGRGEEQGPSDALLGNSTWTTWRPSGEDGADSTATAAPRHRGCCSINRGRWGMRHKGKSWENLLAVSILGRFTLQPVSALARKLKFPSGPSKKKTTTKN